MWENQVYQLDNKNKKWGISEQLKIRILHFIFDRMGYGLELKYHSYA